jgi:hypothetical protein
MPNTLSDVVGSRSRSYFGSVATDNFVPLLGKSAIALLYLGICTNTYGSDLEVPHGFGEQSCCHQVQKARRDNEEDLQRKSVAPSERLVSLSRESYHGHTYL